MDESELKITTHDDSFTTFEKLYHEYKKMFFHYILKFTNNYHTAEDLLQETFFKIARNFHTLKDLSKFKSWGFQVTANTCRDWYKKAMRLKIISTENIENIEDKDLPGQRDEANETLKQAVRQAIGKLKGEEKEVFLMKHYDKMNYEEIAGVLKTSKRTVRRRMKSAVQSFMKEIEGQLK
ncbi:MAG: RNA polymerase sigma factor [Spirochaetes bacterium]|nr:RNA polymerase sigma factor [Spirochaetota bacterium]